MNFDQIPADLRALDQWVVWKYEEVPGNPKPTKVPYRVANPDVKADSTKQGTWGSFEDALAAAEVDGVDGAGFVFSKDDPLTGVDIDDCRDPTTGELHPAASRIMLGLDGYTEISPSGTGVHIIVRAKLNGDRHSTKKTPWGGKFEVYDQERFFTATGGAVVAAPAPLSKDAARHALERMEKPIGDRQEQLDALVSELLPPAPPPPPRPASGSGATADDHELLKRARKAKNGDDFTVLWDGGRDGHGSESEADWSLCSMLAFWAGPDPDRIDSLFRQSGLMREKWDEPRGDSTWGARTIANVLSTKTEFYDWNKPKRRRKNASTPKSTEQTEHNGENPVNTGEKVFGGVPNISPNTPNTLEPPKLASEGNILGKFDEKMGECGLIGERHIARAVYLIHVSRRLPVPGRAVTKGDSSTGKSYATECALKAAAPEFLYVRTSTSALALFYTEQDLRHHTIVFYEANKLGDEDDDLARVVRTLLSENKLKHEATDSKTMSTVLLEKDGPVAFISTVAKPTLDPEIETRILSFHSDGSDDQTAAVVKALLEAATNPKDPPDFTEWHQLDRWLASHPPAEVVVPWGTALGKFSLSGPPRLRRDITNLLSLAKAHALLHRGTREVDTRGRVIATLDDYEVVRALLADALAIATDKAVRSGTREIVEAVEKLRAEKKQPISLRAAARRAGRSPSTTSTDAMDALERGYLVNRSQRDRSYDLDVGDPLPTKEDLLPSKEQLAKSVRCVRWGVRCPTEHETPINTGDLDDCSVCSVDFEGEGDWNGAEAATPEEEELVGRLLETFGDER